MGRISTAVEASASEVRGAEFLPELLRAAWFGDRETFDRLFDAWFAVLYAVAWQQTGEPRRAEALARELAIERIQSEAAQFERHGSATRRSS